MDFTDFSPLLGLLILIPMILGYHKSLVERPFNKKVLSFVCRVGAIALLLLALCHPYTSSERTAKHSVFLLDVSESIDLNAALNALDSIEEQIEQMDTEDSYSLYAFGKELKQFELKELKEKLNLWNKSVSDDKFRNETFIHTSLMTSRLAFPSNKIKELVLFSDGIETDIGIDQALKVLAKEGVHLHWKKIEGMSKAEISIVDFKSNSKIVFNGEILRLKVRMASNRVGPAKLKLIHQGIVISEKFVDLEASDKNDFTIETLVQGSGKSEYKVECESAEDYFLINNKATCSVEVKGFAKVLALHYKTSEMRALVRALKKQGIDLEVRGKMGMPDSLDELLKFDAVLFANIAATDLTQPQMLNLKSYVTNFGGGFLMTGSENSFGLGGYYGSPVEEVLPIVSRYEKEKENPSLAMVLVIDKSGSMTGLPIQMARMAARSTVELLSPRDYVGVVAFDGQAYSVVDMTSASNQDVIVAAIEGLAAGGGTNMYPGMAMGKDMLSSTAARIKHMIVLGDGQSHPGPFEQLVSEMAMENMTVSTVALGNGADRPLMNVIASIGKGRYYETMEAESVPRIFTKETMEASKSAIKEEPFIPIPLGEINFLEGIFLEEAPFLLGYVMTKSKPTAQVHLLTESGEPLLATGRYGLGFGAAFTSDTTDTWAGEWIEWNDFGKFWAQLFRQIMRKQDHQGLLITSRENREEVIYDLYCKDKKQLPINHMKWNAEIHSEYGLKQKVQVLEKGLGRYQIRVKKEKNTKYSMILRDDESQKSKIVHYISSYPKEYRLEADPSDVIQSLPTWDKTKQYKPLETKVAAMNAFLVASLLMMILSVFLRRV